MSGTHDEEFDAAGMAKSANLNGENTVAPAINPSLGRWKGPDEISFVVVYLYLTSAKCTGIPASSLWPEATALTEMVKVELHERKKMKFYNV